MPFYMFTGRYSIDSIKAMVDNPQDREAAARKVVEAGGGKLHNLFFCFGENDFLALVEAPDDTAMGGIALAVGASGALSGGATTKLMTSAEAMKAMKAAGTAAKSYSAPAG
ncbi:GYD domain-containing protein [Halovulum sp. GXIMD14794]